MSSRATLITPPGDPAETPEGAGRVLSEVLGGVPFGLFAAEGKDSFQLCLASNLELDPRDPWALELSTARAWRALGNGDLTPLQALPDRRDLTEPDPGLRARAIREDGKLRGGLLLRLPPGRLSPALQERLQSPVLDGVLSLQLNLAQATRGQRELHRFRMAVVAALPYGFLAIDALGRVTYAGGRAAEILGLSEAEMVGSDCARVFRPVGLGSHPLLDGLRRAPGPLELYLARPDGREVPVSLQMTRLPSQAGARKSLVALAGELGLQIALW